MRTRSRVLGARRLLVVVAASVVLSGCTPAPHVPTAPSRPLPTASASTTSSPSPQFGNVVRSFAIAPSGSSLIAAAAPGVLYTATGLGENEASWRIDRLDLATGTVRTRTLHLPDLRRLLAGPDGLYVSTSAIDKYGAKPDTILRLDLTTLHTLAQRHLDDDALWDGSVYLAAHGDELAETDGGGGIRLLDARDLETERSIQVLSKSDEEAGDDVESPVIRDGRLWVLARHEILSFSLPALHRDSSTPQGLYSAILDTDGGLELVGARLARLHSDGTVAPAPLLADADGTTGTQSAVALEDLIAEQPDDLDPRILLRETNGTVIGTLRLDTDNGLFLARDGNVLWAQGIGSNGPAITAIRIQ